jgi:hypothetical protein
MPTHLMGKTDLKLMANTALNMRMLLEDWVIMLERISMKVDQVVETLSQMLKE